jgi:Sulfotransferase family
VRVGGADRDEPRMTRYVAKLAASKLAATSVSQRRVPDFFIVGHPKCGTTALYEMLRRHPQIYMPDLKEPRFFGRDIYLGPSQRTGGVPDTLDEYLALFDAARPGERAGEASPHYLVSHTAAASIAEMQPTARIIAILREPASFLRSLHLQFVESYVESENDPRKAVSLEHARRQGRHLPPPAHLRPHALFYSEHVQYVEQLRRYHSAFSPEQVLVLIYDDFRRDNEATVKRALRFLGVDDMAPIEVAEANPSVRVRSQRLNSSIRAVYMGQGSIPRAIKTGLKAAIRSRPLRRRALQAVQQRVVYGQPKQADEQLLTEWRQRFKPEVAALSEYLNRDLLTLWGYDNLG